MNVSCGQYGLLFLPFLNLFLFMVYCSLTLFRPARKKTKPSSDEPTKQGMPGLSSRFVNINISTFLNPLFSDMLNFLLGFVVGEKLG